MINYLRDVPNCPEHNIPLKERVFMVGEGKTGMDVRLNYCWWENYRRDVWKERKY